MAARRRRRFRVAKSCCKTPENIPAQLYIKCRLAFEFAERHDPFQSLSKKEDPVGADGIS